MRPSIRPAIRPWVESKAQSWGLEDTDVINRILESLMVLEKIGGIDISTQILTLAFSPQPDSTPPTNAIAQESTPEPPHDEEMAIAFLSGVDTQFEEE